MKFKIGEIVFYEFVGRPHKVEITHVWEKTKRYKFNFSKDNTGWAVDEKLLFSSERELISNKIKNFDLKIEKIKQEREEYIKIFGFVSSEDKRE